MLSFVSAPFSLLPTALLLADGLCPACLKSTLFWAIVCGALALCLAIPRTINVARWLTALLGLASSVLFGVALSSQAIGKEAFVEQVVFLILAAITVLSAAAAISMRSAVYSAIWFAVSLLGTAGLLFFQGAQFLGVATIVVYAGAIVVTLLFVVMLAQPEGHDTYDRIGWGWFAKPTAIIAAVLILAAVTAALVNVREGQVAPRATAAENPVLHPQHVAKLGNELFSRHLLSVEVAGTLLMIALVGAVAIVIQGRDSQTRATAEVMGDE